MLKGERPTVLLVEDDQMTRDALTQSLRDIGYLVRVATSGLDALRQVTESAPDIVVLDLGLPDIDGAEALRMMRGVSSVPVVVATGQQDELRIVRLLHAGADDYLVKPFSVEELAARISAVLRRSRQPVTMPQVMIVGGLRIDVPQREATLDGRLLELNRKEFDVLAYLAAHTERVVTRKEIVEAVWGRPYTGSDQSVDVHVSWLRRKLGESAAQPRYLRTIRGVGLRLMEPR